MTTERVENMAGVKSSRNGAQRCRERQNSIVASG